jgi:hypothetical protein
VQKTLTVGVPRRGICSVLPCGLSDGLFPKLTIDANINNLPGIVLALGKTICFGSLEFTADRFCRLSLSLEGDDSGVVFIGMVHSGSPSLDTVLEESFDESDATSGKGEGEAPDPPTLEYVMW